jgi:hypothetical protein
MAYIEKLTASTTIEGRVIADKLFIDDWEGCSKERLLCNLSYFRVIAWRV